MTSKTANYMEIFMTLVLIIVPLQMIKKYLMEKNNIV